MASAQKGFYDPDNFISDEGSSDKKKAPVDKGDNYDAKAYANVNFNKLLLISTSFLGMYIALYSA